MDNYKISEATFMKDVAAHQLTVMHESGVYRHLRFKRPDSGCMHFDLITYPGHLVYSGDMGHYVFSRLHDMLEFFRTDRQGQDRLYVNLSYWSEKLVAVDGTRRSGSAKEFSEEKFRRIVNEYRLRWMRERDLTKEQRRELWEAIDNDVLDHLDSYGDNDGAMRAANNFSWTTYYGDRGRRKQWAFRDFWDHDFEDYTHRFRWCAFALAWGIRQYDALQAATPKDTP